MPAMKPEIFNYDMIRAILEGRKTVTRRLIKRSGHKVENLLTTERYRGYRYAFSAWDCMEQTKTGIFLAPRHRPGDIIYVRENYAVMSELPDICDTSGIVYMADFSPRELENLKGKHFCWKPSIYMPRKYARLFLQVTNVWPEHVRDITEKQACLEGIDKYDIGSEGIAYGPAPTAMSFTRRPQMLLQSSGTARSWLRITPCMAGWPTPWSGSMNSRSSAGRKSLTKGVMPDGLL